MSPAQRSALASCRTGRAGRPDEGSAGRAEADPGDATRAPDADLSVARCGRRPFLATIVSLTGLRAGDHARLLASARGFVRDREGEHGAHAGLRDDPDAPAVPLHDLLAHR